jgi:hypothetical protein
MLMLATPRVVDSTAALPPVEKAETRAVDAVR